jgi:hypothetical protein
VLIRERLLIISENARGSEGEGVAKADVTTDS